MKDYLLQKNPIAIIFRKMDTLSVPKVETTSFGIKSISFLGPKIWNSLPNKIKSSKMQVNSKFL